MNGKYISNTALDIAQSAAGSEKAERLALLFPKYEGGSDPYLLLDGEGLSLVSDGHVLRGDLTKMIPRVTRGRVTGELLARAAKLKGALSPRAVDATAGLGEDSLILAASGFSVTLYERNPVICELLRDALERAEHIPELADIVGRMTLVQGDSVAAMASLTEAPDVILLDPMFPERQKSALVKKKLQMIQKLEQPCTDEREILLTAMRASPKKLIIKRPPKGPYLAGIKPDHSIEGKAVRFDCFVSPADRIEKFEKNG